MVKQFVAYFDGLCEPVNPGGIATYGFVIYMESGAKASYGYGVAAIGYRGDYATNNVAEYSGAIEALKKLRGLRASEPVLKGDSKLVIKHLRGEWRVRSPQLRPLYLMAKELVGKLKARLEWVPRESNKEADSLSRLAFKEFVEKHYNEFIEAYSKWLPTEKQVKLLKKLGIELEPWMTRSKASRLIKDLLGGNEE